MTAPQPGPATRIRLGVATVHVRSRYFGHWKLLTSVERHGVMSWPTISAVRAVSDNAAREIRGELPQTVEEVQTLIDALNVRFNTEDTRLLMVGHVISLGALVSSEQMDTLLLDLVDTRQWIEGLADLTPTQRDRWLMLCETGAEPAEAISAVVALEGL